MLKINKLLLGFVLTFCFVWAIASQSLSTKVDASNKVASDDTGTSTFTSVETVAENLFGVHHEIVTGTSTTGGQSFGQYINEFEMKTDGVTSKLVTWACQSSSNNTHFVKKAITAAAKDYEANHPGWIVVGGINADQYFMSYGHDQMEHGTAIYQPAPCYPMIMDGEILFAVTQAYNQVSNAVGFTNDGTADDFVELQYVGDMRLSIIDEDGNAVKYFTINNFNESAGAGETSVWISPFDGTNSTTQYDVVPVTCNTDKSLYVVTNAELAYVGQSEDWAYESPGMNQFFGRGTIDATPTGTYTFQVGQFGIETDNADVKAALASGVRIRVEQVFKTDEMNACKEGVGYHSCHKRNNVENVCDQGYDSQKYSRSLFGKKADGTYVLITADMVTNYVSGKTSSGLNWTECNAVANYYGLTDMYQMDGGGSTTAMVRQSDGTFKVTNYPKDSKDPESPRSDFSYLFFVVRDSGVQVDSASTTYHSITLKNTVESDDIVSFKVLINGQTYDYYDGIVIDGLEEETTYTITYQYTIQTATGKFSNEYSVKETTTRYERPSNPIEVTERNKHSLSFKVKDGLSVQLQDIKIYLGSEEYDIGTKTEFTIDDLIEDQKYEFYATYTVYDEVSKTTFEGKTRTYDVSTIDFELPKIVKFNEYSKEGNSIQFEYKYTDDDDIVLDAYILYGDTKVTLDRKSGKQTIDGLDFSGTDYTFKMVVEYIKGTLESEELTYTHTGETNPDSGTGDGGTTTGEETTTKKKGCKKGANLVISMIGLTTAVALILRKRK